MNCYLKPALICIAAVVGKMMLPVDPNFEMENNVYKRKLYQRLNIGDMQIQDPFKIETQNNFIDSPREKIDEGKEWYDLWFILEGKRPNKCSVLEAFRKFKVR